MLIEGDRMAEVAKVRPSQPSRKVAAGKAPPHHEKCSVGERLYSQVHVCNHARCAANDPDYNVKSAVPPRKFLVAKKHTYGGLEDKGEKKRTTTTSSGSSSTTTSPDHHLNNRTHALKSLTNSVLTRESGSNGGSNGKVRANGLRSNVHSVVQSRRATRDTNIISSDPKKVAERKGRTTSSSIPSRSSTARSSVTAIESHSTTAHKSRLSSAASIASPAATEQSKQWREDSTSPANSITSIRITQIVSTRREEQNGEGDDETQELHELVAAAASSSPTASVGSNHDPEISSLKETVLLVEEVGIFEQPTANAGELQSPANSSSQILQKNSLGNKQANGDSPSPSSLSVDSRAPVSESLSPSTPSTSFESTAPEGSSVTTTPATKLSSRLRKTAVGGKEINGSGSSPSLDSRPTTSGSLTSTVTSLKSGPRLSPASTVRSSRTTTPSSSSSDKLARNLLNKLKESSKVGAPLSSPLSSSPLLSSPFSSSPLSSSPSALVNRPSRIPRSAVSPASPVESSTAPTNASKSAKRFATDLQGKSVARRSTKGVRSIELRGGKAQSYSTTTVTSWNMTTTTVETSVSISEITTEKRVEAGFAGSGGLEEVSSKPEQSSKKDLKAIKDAPTTVKFAKNARSLEEVLAAEPETVALKHGEVAERRLSEEYMTNHALEGVVKKISENDHRVKVLVHAFETLANLTDAEALAIDERTLNQQLAHESLSATTIAV
ncbi:unnamed protein product [Calypogeia fissa]